MAATDSNQYFGLGIYSLREAWRLTGVPTHRIRRWLRGYGFLSGGKKHRSPPVWQGQLDPIEGSLALGFLDLVELRCVDAFIKAGVTWPTMRKAREAASKSLRTEHPFCTARFSTDGRAVFLKLEPMEGDPGLLDIVSKQRYFEKIMRPLIRQLEFARAGTLSRWWPLGMDHAVVLDPHRSFGRPIVDAAGVPTDVLSQALQVNRDLEEVCRWYEVSKEEALDVKEFERSLAA